MGQGSEQSSLTLSPAHNPGELTQPERGLPGAGRERALGQGQPALTDRRHAEKLVDWNAIPVSLEPGLWEGKSQKDVVPLPLLRHGIQQS